MRLRRHLLDVLVAGVVLTSVGYLSAQQGPATLKGNGVAGTWFANVLCVSSANKDDYLGEVAANDLGVYTNGTNCASGTQRADFSTTALTLSSGYNLVAQGTGLIEWPNGTAAAPSLVSATDTTSGRYRLGANNYGESVAGSAVFDWNATRLNFISGYPVTWNGDSGLSRLGAASFALGTQAQGDFTGTLKLTTLNAVTGLQINGAATTGTFLRGNGTNYLASTLTLPNTSVQGDLLVATGTSVEGAITAVATGQVLTSAGVSLVPAYSAVPVLGVAGSQAGTLGLANGAGGGAVWTLASAATSGWTLTSKAVAPAQGDLFTFSNATGQMASVVDVAVNQVLTSGGVGAVPAYSGSPTLTQITLTGSTPLIATGSTDSVTSSSYAADTDSTLAAGVGNNTASYNGVFRGILRGANLTSTAVTQSSVHGVFFVTGTDASTWPKAAVVGEVHDNTTVADAAVIALMGGDAGNSTQATAAFATRSLSSTPSNQFTYGLDFGGSVAGFTSAAQLIKSADIRFSSGAWFVDSIGAITANTTTTTAPAGSLATTTNATGRGSLYYSDGSKWQGVFVLLTGDATTVAGSNAVTVAKVNGVTYSAAPATNTVPVITASNTATYTAMTNCLDSGGNHLNYSTATSLFSCGTTSAAGQLVLLKAGSGTSSAAGATVLDSVALSGLTAKDTLQAIFQITCTTSTSGTITLYSTTDSGSVANFNGCTAGGSTLMYTAYIRQSQTSATTYWSITDGEDSGLGTTPLGGLLNFNATTAWTGSWTIGLRYASLAGGTLQYSWTIYKIAGQ